MRRRDERLLDAYRDGALDARERARVEQRLQRESDARARVQQTDGVGRAIREAWTDAPPAPSPEYLIAALRPELTRIDEELAREGLIRRFGEWLRDALRPVPAAALVGVCAVALLVLMLPEDIRRGPLAERDAPYQVSAVNPVATPFYDLAQGDKPLLILEAQDGSTVIWVLDDPDQLSFSSDTDGWA